MSMILSTLLPLLKRALPLIWYAVLFLCGHHYGRRSVKQAQNNRNTRVLQDMAHAQADKPVTSQTVIERLERGKS